MPPLRGGPRREGGKAQLYLLDFVNILQEELVCAVVLPRDYDFDAHKQLMSMQPGDVRMAA